MNVPYGCNRRPIRARRISRGFRDVGKGNTQKNPAIGTESTVFIVLSLASPPVLAAGAALPAIASLIRAGSAITHPSGPPTINPARATCRSIRVRACAKRLLQHYRHIADIGECPLSGRFGGRSRHRAGRSKRRDWPSPNLSPKNLLLCETSSTQAISILIANAGGERKLCSLGAASYRRHRRCCLMTAGRRQWQH